MNSRTTLVTAGLAGVSGVALGAFGAHALRDRLLAQGTAKAWETGTHYHLLHAVALLAIAIWLKSEAEPALRKILGWTARAWALGIVLFSGSLYLLALGGPRWLGPITPFGGTAFLAGWTLLIVAACKTKR